LSTADPLLPTADSQPVLQFIGDTPLIPLADRGPATGATRVLRKAERGNPGGSGEIRPAGRMLGAPISRRAWWWSSA